MVGLRRGVFSKHMCFFFTIDFSAELDSLLRQSSGSQLPGVSREEALLHLGVKAVNVEDGQVIHLNQLNMNAIHFN